MAKMTPEMIQTIEKQNPVPIATASADSIPNVAFVGFLKVVNEDTIMVADNFFNKTKQNLQENNKVAFVVYDGYTKRSYQIKGTAEVKTSGPEYDEMVEWVNSLMPDMPKKAAVMIHVDEVFDSQPGPKAGSKII
ncbi:pyridoxamine 5'-phosphate oxidase family protein [Methanosalsum natronophilum]|uniref:Pyridoxamine 5'-phosphate oxidase n=1 Tax=Methanosalsum natronophilum TaxID=768733 RepID=A0A424YLK4_9EURY|nr:pyridoxamine 5'-phosphate oxidase family protein [Methanosalsum natronophilum]MCS3923662.1 putative pyridoxine 5'-phosphate oxidase superfamily flavin-nucleotide-binding protein [Methanosalsum natronophilum]RQD79863.1 MAG: pyridoxamine 5'-phosphate oxidase [Methanosalsum natronophilum]